MKIRMGLIGLAVAGVLAASVGSGGAEEAKAPDATVEFTEGSVAAGIGFSWGSGTLTYKGKKYPISVDGLSVGSVGASSVSASGKVYHLKKVEDFDGNYAAVGTGATVGGGGGVSTMRNQNGVVIDVVATTQGLSSRSEPVASRWRSRNSPLARRHLVPSGVVHVVCSSTATGTEMHEERRVGGADADPPVGRGLRLGRWDDEQLDRLIAAGRSLLRSDRQFQSVVRSLSPKGANS